MADLTGQSLGRYHILGKLGEGGMATVYKAFDTRLERDVAIKVIRSEAFSAEISGQMLQRFEREARALSKLTQTNIVPVIDYGDFEGSPYLVMPYIPGGTLKHCLEGGPLDYKRAAHLLAPVARALAFAHTKNILHRDIKPSNILITEDGSPMISDFGVAKILEDEQGTTLTNTGVGLGTPGYMAPEQWMGKATFASDQYSLGVVFYEMITGRKPYTADTPPAILLKQVNEPLPRPRNYIPDLPDSVEKIIFKSMAKNPEDRYSDMLAFAAGLDNLQSAAQSDEQETVLNRELKTTTGETIKDPIKYGPIAVEKPTLKVAPGYTEIPPPVINYPYIHSTGESFHSQKKHSIIYWLGGVTLLIAVAIIFFVLGNKKNIAPEPGIASTGTTAVTLQTLKSPEPSSTISSTLKPVLDIGSTTVSEKDGMTLVYVPAGDFIMGSNDYRNEQPVHTVYLDSYWIDKYEVTNAMYRTCVSEGICTPPFSATRYNNPQYDDHPVVYIDWSQAASYCEWAGRELPTEAQWEKAARGTSGQIYPWGNESPTCNLANTHDCLGDTSPVGSYEAGKSPYGAYDMAGNAWEWVADWYGLYSSLANSNPTGPKNGDGKVFRGGSWGYESSDIRAANRLEPTGEIFGIGVRCALMADFSN